jgi:hypothetical protein
VNNKEGWLENMKAEESIKELIISFLIDDLYFAWSLVLEQTGRAWLLVFGLQLGPFGLRLKPFGFGLNPFAGRAEQVVEIGQLLLFLADAVLVLLVYIFLEHCFVVGLFLFARQWRLLLRSCLLLETGIFKVQWQTCVVCWQPVPFISIFVGVGIV